MTGVKQIIWTGICPSDTLSTTNPTWTDLALTPNLRSENPATDSLKHGTAQSEGNNRCAL